MHPQRKPEFKRVPALDKCFALLGLLAQSDQSLSISEISRKLNLNKSTVFNIVHTLEALDVLEHGRDGKFNFGTYLYRLGNDSGRRADLIRTVRPYLNEIATNSCFSAFLGIRSGLKAVIVDKVEAAVDIKVSSEVGMRLPLLAGASGKALLSQLSDSHIDQILAAQKLKKYTSLTTVDKNEYRAAILRVRDEGIALDMGEYIEGIVAAAIPMKTHRENLQAAIWAVGLKRHHSEGGFAALLGRLKRIAADLDIRFGCI
jgi:IclR family KDG regulon transcriptional repressor